MSGKCFLVVCDGLGDLRVDGKTPLEAAKSPNLDRLAKEGAVGLMHTVGRGRVPGSDTGHLSIFGFDPEKNYCGRGPLEAMGSGVELKHGDVAFRANFATLDKNGSLVDRRAGRISEDTSPLAEKLEQEIDGVKIRVYPGVEHRATLVLSGEDLSDRVSDTDPHEEGKPVLEAKALDSSKGAEKTASVLNRLSKLSFEILDGLDFNEERRKQGKPAANVLLARGAGLYQQIAGIEEVYGLKAACVAGGPLYKGAAKYVGMSVLSVSGATGTKDTDLSAKAEAAIGALEKNDLVFVHVKATDSFSHDGDFDGKKKMIERIDSELVSELSKQDALIVLTGDHSTPVSLKRHSSHPIPIVFCGGNVRRDEVDKFDEYSAMRGGLGHLVGLEVMPKIQDLIGKSHVYGA